MKRILHHNKWVLWLIAMLLGALIGAIVSFATPVKFRAQATVVVDFNIEETWETSPDNEIFYFLDREARKLEELAWADETLEKVATNTGLTMAALRAGVLELGHPKDGGWHFYASSNDPKIAQNLAGSWANAFVENAHTAIEVENRLATITNNLEMSPGDAALSQEKLILEAMSKGLLAGTHVSISQTESLPIETLDGSANFILAGALIGLMLALVWEDFPFWGKS